MCAQSVGSWLPEIGCELGVGRMRLVEKVSRKVCAETRVQSRTTWSAECRIGLVHALCTSRRVRPAQGQAV